MQEKNSKKPFLYNAETRDRILKVVINYRNYAKEFYPMISAEDFQRKLNNSYQRVWGLNSVKFSTDLRPHIIGYVFDNNAILPDFNGTKICGYIIAKGFDVNIFSILQIQTLVNNGKLTGVKLVNDKKFGRHYTVDGIDDNLMLRVGGANTNISHLAVVLGKLVNDNAVNYVTITGGLITIMNEKAVKDFVADSGDATVCNQLFFQNIRGIAKNTQIIVTGKSGWIIPVATVLGERAKAEEVPSFGRLVNSKMKKRVAKTNSKNLGSLDEYLINGLLKNDEIHKIKDLYGDRCIVIPDGMMVIPDKWQMNNSDVEIVVMNDNVRIVGNHAFANCKNLKYVVNAFIKRRYDLRYTDLASTPNMAYIKEGAFCGCRSLVSVAPMIDSGLICGHPWSRIVIERKAFKDCAKLAEVYFEKPIELFLGDRAFENCASLRTVNLPAFVYDRVLEYDHYYNGLYIDDNYFSELYIGWQCLKLARGIFDNCDKLKNIHSSTWYSCDRINIANDYGDRMNAIYRQSLVQFKGKKHIYLLKSDKDIVEEV